MTASNENDWIFNAFFDIFIGVITLLLDFMWGIYAAVYRNVFEGYFLPEEAQFMHVKESLLIPLFKLIHTLLRIIHTPFLFYDKIVLS